MARSAVRKIEEPPRRRIMDVIIFAGIAVTLLFALVGLVSAGTFVGGKLSGGTKAHHTANNATSRTGGQGVAAAQVQATQIVRAARAAEHAIVVSATTKANRRAKAIIRNAKRDAAQTRAAASAAASTHASTTTGSSASSSAPAASTGSTTGTRETTTGSTAAPSAPSTGSQSASGTGSLSTSAGASSAASSTGVQTYVTPVAPSSLAPASSVPANLGGLPATWKVVAYNAAFGSGPGSAGSITVTNRSTRTFSGTARVAYNGGGSAAASFAGLAPGQTVVLPLNGIAYPGRGFRIQVLDVH